MSLTSYRAAPPRVGWWWGCGRGGAAAWLRVGVMRGGGGRWTWRRPTLPRLETQYHGRFGVSRPSSEWGRVGHPRYGHQVEQPSRTARDRARTPARRCTAAAMGILARGRGRGEAGKLDGRGTRLGLRAV